MTKKVLKVPLSQKGVQEAIDYLEDYKNSLTSRCEKLLKALSERGISEANVRFQEAENDSTDTSHAYVSDVAFDGDTVTLDLTVSGKDIFFIEYGAGVYYNGHLGESAHESEKFRAAHPEFLIGKYRKDPEDDSEWSKGAKDYWFYGNGKFTHGTKATMPVYGATQAMSDLQNIRDAAQEAFSD